MLLGGGIDSCGEAPRAEEAQALAVSSYPHLDHQVALMNFPLVLAGAYPSQLQESGGSQSRQYAVDLAKVNLG